MRPRLQALAHVALLLAALLACGGGGKDKPEKAEADPVDPAERATATNVKTLVSDYAANGINADAKWKDKLVDVAGAIGDVRKTNDGVPFVALSAVGGEQLGCVLKDGQENAASRWTKGTKATFRGRVLGSFDGVVILDECERVAAGAAPAPPPQAQAPRPQQRAVQPQPVRPPPPPPPPRKR